MDRNEIAMVVRAVDAASKVFVGVEQSADRMGANVSAVMGQVANATNQANSSLGRMREANDAVAPASLQMGRAIADSRNALFTFNQTSEETKQTTVALQQEMKKTGERANEIDREWKKLTSSTEFAAQGIQMLRGTLNSIVWGTILGGITAIILKMAEWAFKTRDVTQENQQLMNTLEALANRVDPLRDKTEAYARAQYEMAAIQLQIEKVRAELTLPGLRAELTHLQALGQGYIGLFEAIKLFFTLTGTQSENMKALQGRTEEYRLKSQELDLQIQQMTASLGTQILSWDELQAKIKQDAGLKAYSQTLEQLYDRYVKLTSSSQYYLQYQEYIFRRMGMTAEQAKDLVDLLSEIEALENRATKSLFPETTIDPTAGVMQTMRENIAVLEEYRLQQEALNGAFGPTPQRIAEMNAEMERSIQISQMAGQAVGTVINAIQQMGIAGQFSGKMFAAAMLGFVAQTLSSLAVMATSKAIESLAWAQYAQGLALLGHPTAAAAAGQFYASAAFWGKVAVGAGVGAVATGIAAGRLSADARGGGGSGGGGGTASVTPEGLRGPEESRRNGPVEVYVYTIDPRLVDYDRLVREEIAPAAGRLLEDGGTFGGVIIHHSRP